MSRMSSSIVWGRPLVALAFAILTGLTLGSGLYIKAQTQENDQQFEFTLFFHAMSKDDARLQIELLEREIGSSLGTVTLQAPEEFARSLFKDLDTKGASLAGLRRHVAWSAKGQVESPTVDSRLKEYCNTNDETWLQPQQSSPKSAEREEDRVLKLLLMILVVVLPFLLKGWILSFWEPMTNLLRWCSQGASARNRRLNLLKLWFEGAIWAVVASGTLGLFPAVFGVRAFNDYFNLHRLATCILLTAIGLCWSLVIALSLRMTETNSPRSMNYLRESLIQRDSGSDV